MLQVSLQGWEEYMAKLKAAPDQLKQDIDAEVEAAAKMFEAGAKRDLNTGDRGTLRRSINHKRLAIMNYSIGTPLFYAPYIEFGTKKKVKIEPGFEAEAAAAKGLPQRGGQLKFFDTIREWVRRKQIAKGKELDSVAFLIARSILRNGISPKPFFFKQYSPVKKLLIERVKRKLGIK
jgi:hypothetical protein